MKQTVRLTESELRRMINESVEMVINEAMQDEGFFDGISAVKDKASNFLRRKGQNLQQNTRNFVDNTIDKTKEYYNKKKEQIGQGVQNMKNTYNAGSINGDAQKYLKNACDALANLKQANQRLIDNGLNPIFNNRQINYINTIYKTLSNKYSQAFSNMKNGYTNPSGQQ